MDNYLQHFIYARKSSESEDRQVLSIDSQKRELLDLIKRDGLNIADIKEEAHSAKSPGRRGLPGPRSREGISFSWAARAPSACAGGS